MAVPRNHINDGYSSPQERGVRREGPSRPFFKHTNSDEKSAKPKMNLVNFCVPGIIHQCSKYDHPDHQKDCVFYRKATFASHCMQLRCNAYCANEILHKYLSGSISENRARILIRNQNQKYAKIESKARGFHIIFPSDDVVTTEDLPYIFEQLNDLGITHPSFWKDKYGVVATNYAEFEVTIESIKKGIWTPVKQELLKDILKYLELRKKFGV